MAPEPPGQGWDVLVAGGGPAGCSAAIQLAGQGARVLLCETKAGPHHKLCGEFLSPECGPLLDALGVGAAVRALGLAPIDTAVLSVPAGTTWETRLPGTAWGLTRRSLDDALLERAAAAGATVWRGATVCGVRGSLAGGFRVVVSAGTGRRETAVRSVVAAHGKRGVLDRALGRRFLNRPQPFVALKRHLRGPALPGRIELHSFPGGYCGLSAVEAAAGGAEGVANVCLLVHASAWAAAIRAAAGADRAQAFVDWMRSQAPRLDAWLSRATPLGERWLSIAQVPFGPKPAVEAEVLFAGDAAGLIAPLAGNGIAMALRGGMLAAEHLLPFLRGRTSAAALPASYQRAWRREFGARLRLGRLAQALMLRPALFGIALRLLNAVPPLGRYVVAHTRDVRLAAAAPKEGP